MDSADIYMYVYIYIYIYIYIYTHSRARLYACYLHTFASLPFTIYMNEYL